ncbi:MAG TPA: hypothetical protein VF230_01315 [Acidimicrobiales bacterium]
MALTQRLAESPELELSALTYQFGREFPDVEHATLERLVHASFERHRDARIRTFVGIFVARDVRAALRAQPLQQ